jgi:DnaK suppressor protein
MRVYTPPISTNVRSKWRLHVIQNGGETPMSENSKANKKSNTSNGIEPNLDPDYVPGDDEEFMNKRQLQFFEKQLHDWRAEILEESRGTLNQLQDAPIREPDMNDRASSETDWSIELRTRDRQRKLISKIESALQRISDGEYGYCQVTGEPISLARLRARPIATMTLEAQERHERQERVSRDD